MTAIFAVSGPSGSGKTTLLEKLIRELKGRGFSVAAAKHDPHDHAALDTPGKDSWRLTQAGAQVVDVIGPNRRTSFAGSDDSLQLSQVLSREALASDVVLVEGFKRGSLPRLEIVPRGRTPRLEPGTLALIADEKLECSVPVFARDDTAGITDFLTVRMSSMAVTVVLAGGSSSRMGKDKASLVLPEGDTMLERAISICRSVSQRTIVVTRHAAHQQLARRAGADFLVDDGPQHPASGIVAALEALGSPVVALPCDSPALKPRVLARLTEVNETDFACFAIAGRLHPLPGLYRPAALPHLQEIASGGAPLYSLASRVPSLVLSEHEARALDPELGSFDSINTLHDFKAKAGRETPEGRPRRTY